MRVRWTAAALGCGLAAWIGAGAVAAQPAPEPPGQVSPTPSDPAFTAAKAAFEALPEAERKAIQDALVWTGDYNATITGTFGKRTYDAVVAYQRRAKLNPNGILDPKARAGLQATAQRAREAVKFAAVADPKTGVSIGVPAGILTRRDANPNGGARWQSADEKITLDTRAIPPGQTDLAALYERNLAIQTPGRQVTYKLLRPDFFVIAGETPTGRFYTRYASGPAGVHGFSLGYDKAIRDFDRIVVAIANSFVPFPEAGAAAAAPAAPLRPGSLMATGLAVAPRRVLTAAEAERCPDLRVTQAKARVVAADAAKGLALLEWEGTRTPGPLVLQTGSEIAEDDWVVLSFSGAQSSLVATPAGVASGRLVAPLQPGASGAPAFSRSGAVAALVGAVPATPRMVAGVATPAAYPMIPAEAVAAFLAANGIALPGAAASDVSRSAGEIAATAGAAMVSIECAR